MDKKLQEQLNKVKTELEFLNSKYRSDAERSLKCLNLIKDIEKKVKKL